MLCKGRHGTADVSAMQAADVTCGECAKVQGAPTRVCVHCSSNALLSGIKRWVLAGRDPTGN